MLHFRLRVERVRFGVTGREFFAQAVVHDAAANSAGLVVSNAVRLLLGSR